MNIADKKISFVSSYIKKECGIASYSRDVIRSIKAHDKIDIDIFAVESVSAIKKGRNSPISKVIKPTSESEYIIAANMINQGDVDLVHIQHEFGLYAGEEGKYILDFANHIRKPSVITFHTVLNNPDPKKKAIIEGLSESAKAVIVMAKSGVETLEKVYGVDRHKITLIPHGVPGLKFEEPDRYKDKISYGGREIISTFGLLNPGKGIEYVLESLRSVKKIYPNILFLIIGQTHPRILLAEGENYRRYLERKVLDFGLQNNVKFINKYLTLKELIIYLRASDIYITPYLEPQQVTSGTLAYAMGVGKVCISTPYIYAKEMLSNGRGRLVPFRDSKRIGENITDLFSNRDVMSKIAKSAYDFSRKMTWSNVGKEHIKLYESLIK